MANTLRDGAGCALAWIGNRGTLILAASIVAGLAIPQLSAFTRTVFQPVVFVMLVGGLVRFDMDDLISCLKRPAALISGLAWMLVITPLLTLAAIKLGAASWLSPGLILALLIFAGSPAINSTPSFCGMMKLDTGLGVALLVIGVMAAPFTLYTLLVLAGQTAMPFTPFDLFWRLAAMVAGAITVAAAIRCWIGRERLVSHADMIDGGNVLVLVLFATGVMDGIGAELLARPRYILEIMALVTGGYLVFLIITTALTWGINRRTGLTLGFAAANRNLGVIAGALAGLLSEDLWYFMALLQIPNFLFPAILKPVFARALAQARHEPGDTASPKPG